MKRGDIITVVAPGTYGKPRPAIIIQNNFLNETHASIILCLFSTDIQDAPLFRMTINPDNENGLQSISQIMIDKIVALPRTKIGIKIGNISKNEMVSLERSLAFVLGIG